MAEGWYFRCPRALTSSPTPWLRVACLLMSGRSRRAGGGAFLVERAGGRLASDAAPFALILLPLVAAELGEFDILDFDWLPVLDFEIPDSDWPANKLDHIPVADLKPEIISE